MKRPLRRFEVIYLAVVLGGDGACTPNNSVKPGAPVLTQVAIVEGGGAAIHENVARSLGLTRDLKKGSTPERGFIRALIERMVAQYELGLEDIRKELAVPGKESNMTLLSKQAVYGRIIEREKAGLAGTAPAARPPARKK